MDTLGVRVSNIVLTISYSLVSATIMPHAIKSVGGQLNGVLSGRGRKQIHHYVTINIA